MLSLAIPVSAQVPACCSASGTLSVGDCLLPTGNPMRPQLSCVAQPFQRPVLTPVLVAGRLQAAYIRVPRSTRQKVQKAGVPFRDGLHAASHSVLNVLPLFLMCDSSDMGSECDNPYDTRFRPERILIYDKHPGGIGLAEQVGHMDCCTAAHALQGSCTL